MYSAELMTGDIILAGHQTGRGWGSSIIASRGEGARRADEGLFRPSPWEKVPARWMRVFLPSPWEKVHAGRISVFLPSPWEKVPAGRMRVFYCRVQRRGYQPDRWGSFIIASRGEGASRADEGLSTFSVGEGARRADEGLLLSRPEENVPARRTRAFIPSRS